MSLLVPRYRSLQPGELQRFLLPRKPAVLGSTVIAIGDSLTAGTGSTLSTTSSNSGDARRQLGSWFTRLCGAHPDRYYPIRNAGVGGDVIGGIGRLAADAAQGATSITVIVEQGTRPHSTGIGIYLGGLAGSGAPSMFPSAFVSNGNKSYTLTVPALSAAHSAGEVVSWGTFARLDVDVVAWRPETALILLGTNDSGALTATEAVDDGLMQMGQYLRSKGIEPIFLELLPRSTNMSAIASFNDRLRWRCSQPTASREGPFHLVPTYRTFAGSDGKLNSTYDYDGTHMNDTGYALLATTVHAYLNTLPMRITQVPRSAYDTDPTNLIQNANMRNKTAVRVTTVNGALGSGDTTINLTDNGSINYWPSASFVCIIDRGLVTEEQVLVGTRGGGGGLVCSTVTRGYNSTTAVAHSASASIEAVDGGYYPTGWTDVPYFSTDIEINVEAPGGGDNIVGNWATITAASGTGNRSLRYTIPTQNLNDVLLVSARVKTTGFSGGCVARVQFLTGLYNLDLGYDISADMDMTLMCRTTGLSSIAQSDFSIQLLPNGGSGKLWVAEPLIQNLTTLGRT